MSATNVASFVLRPASMRQFAWNFYDSRGQNYAIIRRPMKLGMIVIAIVSVIACPLSAGAVTLDFETLADLEIVTNQFAGVTFSNTVALQSFNAAGGSLFDDDFPPASGVTVVSNGTATVIGGSIVIDFTTPVTSVSGLFTYAAPLTLTALDAGLSQVAQAFSALSENFVSSGGSPNELIQLAFAGGIAELRIDTASSDLLFTLDDLTFTPLVVSAVPGPATIGLVGAVVLGAFVGSRLLVRVRRTRR